MKRTFLGLVACISILSSCKNEPKQTPEQQPASVNTTQCYSYATDKDTVSLKLTFEGNEVMGDLSYKYFQKDQSKGTLIGVMTGDTLFAIYTFTSEAVESTREVAFLKKGNDLVEGYGNVQEKDGLVIFANKGSLDFSSKILLKLVECGK
ncbi:MAG TPA: hypothetical protein VIX80_06625 [Candidatus Kapabacteria bacterium]